MGHAGKKKNIPLRCAESLKHDNTDTIDRCQMFITTEFKPPSMIQS